MKKIKLAKTYLQRANLLVKKINRFCWDGEWFYRATLDNQNIIGSKKNKEGKIFANPQIWAIIADATSEVRKKQLFESLMKYLYTDYGVALLQPAYSIPDENIGYLTRYAPGLRENGGIYMHVSCWALWALCVLDKNEEAYELYKRMSPILNGLKPDLYYAEPYVMPGNIDGPDSPHYGRASWTWYTGSASWFFRVLLQEFLGIKPDFDKLLIEPKIPKEWDGFTVKRKFRNKTYIIEVKRDKKTGKLEYSYKIKQSV